VSAGFLTKGEQALVKTAAPPQPEHVRLAERVHDEMPDHEETQNERSKKSEIKTG